MRDVGACHIVWPASWQTVAKVAAVFSFTAENLLKQEAG